MVHSQTLSGSRFGIIADAHVHPDQGPALPDLLEETFRQVDAIIALGDMGESAGLDWLERIAPVHAVRGVDDAQEDPRITGEIALLEANGLLIGAVFDGAKHELLSSNDPVVPHEDIAGAATGIFNATPQVLLLAASHKSFIGSTKGMLIVNPGSPTLAEEKSVALLTITNNLVEAQIRSLP